MKGSRKVESTGGPPLFQKVLFFIQACSRSRKRLERKEEEVKEEESALFRLPLLLLFLTAGTSIQVANLFPSWRKFKPNQANAPVALWVCVRACLSSFLSLSFVRVRDEAREGEEEEETSGLEQPPAFIITFFLSLILRSNRASLLPFNEQPRLLGPRNQEGSASSSSLSSWRKFCCKGA